MVKIEFPGNLSIINYSIKDIGRYQFLLIVVEKRYDKVPKK